MRKSSGSLRGGAAKETLELAQMSLRIRRTPRAKASRPDIERPSGLWATATVELPMRIED